MGPPQGDRGRVVGARGKAVVQRRQRPVPQSAVPFQAVARRRFVDQPESLQATPRQHRDPGRERDQHQHMHYPGQQRKKIEQRHAEKQPGDGRRRPQAPPQALPKEGRAGQPQEHGIFAPSAHPPASRAALSGAASQGGKDSRATMASTLMRSRTTAYAASLTRVSGTRGRALYADAITAP